MIIKNQTFDAERALYNLKDSEVVDCIFAGPADGESAFKEGKNIKAVGCRFSLRYPFWHDTGFEIVGCDMDNLTRAALWYSKDGVITDTKLHGIKALRECASVDIAGCDIDSAEFGWRCKNINIKNTKINSEYFLFETKGGNISKVDMTGKYSFQYTENLYVADSTFKTKDAFWHSKNVTVKDSVISGEYLAWYSEGLTLINCKISGTQPLCYCKDLTLINCTMVDCDLAFEYSSVNAQINGHIDSVKNPASGRIVADSIGEIIIEDSVIETSCEIITNK